MPRHGCSAWTLTLLACFGCNKAPPETAQTAAAPIRVVATSFDQANTGTIAGRVLWQGNPPDVPPFKVHTNRYPGKEALQGITRARPNVPRIDRETGGVAGAVVFLRGVDPKKARPWNHAAVRIEQRDLRLQVFEGEEPVRAAFVRLGASIEMVSRDKLFYSLHADGADYFTFTLAERERPRFRRMERRGLIELSSGAGYYWMRGYILVADHPYYVRTDERGCFQLHKVPAGDYQLVLWMPSWKIARQERDPESALVNRVFLAPALEQQKKLRVDSGLTATADFQISGSMFAD